jgi:conserved oligomeric Golgi complex subunit 1
MSSLLSLSTSIQHLGVYREPSRQRQDIERTLCHFIVELIKNDRSEGAVHRQLANSPSRSDLAVLRNMISRWNSGSPGWIEVSELLDKKMASTREVVSSVNSLRISILTSIKTYSDGSDLNNDPDNDAAEYLARTQVLFSTLLPNPLGDRETSSEVNEKPTILLPLGIPVVEKDYHPAFRIAKPLSRFGLVLVGNETIQY